MWQTNSRNLCPIQMPDATVILSSKVFNVHFSLSSILLIKPHVKLIPWSIQIFMFDFD